MENKRSEFKKLLEETVIPEVMSYEEREPLLKPLLEYVHSIIPQKLICAQKYVLSQYITARIFQP